MLEKNRNHEETLENQGEDEEEGNKMKGVIKGGRGIRSQKEAGRNRKWSSNCAYGISA